jgi:hypothetical protein
MSFGSTNPEILTAAANSGVGLARSTQDTTAALTTGAALTSAEGVSASTTARLAAHAQMYQAISAPAEPNHESLVHALGDSTHLYVATEAASLITVR